MLRPFAVLRLLVMLVLLGPAAAAAQEAPAADAAKPWQDVITGQIEAFRHHDAPAALSFAGASFQETFSDPQAFFVAVIGSGYAPIMESRSHDFGAYRMVGKTQVMQVVTFTGTDQRLYQAVYELMHEDGGWRVEGVMLSAPMGVGI